MTFLPADSKFEGVSAVARLLTAGLTGGGIRGLLCGLCSCACSHLAVSNPVAAGVSISFL